ncbi:MAG: TNT domain-containing protein, partial [Bacteroidota bacterium]|nr:TNT domain-containing protein [Bacteroidota bacterium]
TITAPAFALHVGGGPATAAAPAAVAAALTRLRPAEVPTPGLVSTPGTGTALPAPPEYTLDEFKTTVWGADQVPPAVITQLYDHFVAAKAALQAKADPAPHWAAMATLVHSTTYLNPKTGLPEVLNGGWPPASGGFNKRLVQPTPPDTFDRYQKEVTVDKYGLPVLQGTFTSPVPAGGTFDYEARALEGQEKEYDLAYEIELLKPLPFAGEEADIIPWHGHTGNGVQTKMLFPPRDPVTGEFPWNWAELKRKGYIKITYKNSPSGKFLISPDGATAILKSI